MIAEELQMLMNRIPGSISQYTSSIPIDQEVEYDDAQHKYYINDKGKLINYISATTIVSQFYEKFDTEAKCAYMVEHYGQSIEYWRNKWRNENTISLHRGNRLHADQERFLYQCGRTTINNDTRTDVLLPREYWVHVRKEQESGALPISALADGCYPELKLWCHDWRIAGRADKPTIETIQGIRYAHVEDYKTNKAVHKNGFVDKWGNEKMMLYPLEHLPDCEYTHYTLQLSIYQFMLEQFGYTPGLRRLIHFPHEIEGLGTPDPVIYELPYWKDEVLTMLIVLNQIPIS